jgi:RNA polymerase sigma factor (sigma-70 family)
MISSQPRAVVSPRAFELEVSVHLPMMFRFAASLSSLDDAEDVVQDALARAWVKRAQFDPARGSLRSWLLAIVANQARGRWRRRRPIWTCIDSSTVLSAEPEGADFDLRRCVARLPRQRAAIVLHHFVDLPIAEIAGLMAVHRGR